MDTPQIPEDGPRSAEQAPLPQYRVSDDFNTRLLNRIADERYAEVRSKAYLPKTAPVVTFRQVVPALATFALVAFVAVGALKDFPGGVNDASSIAGSGDDVVTNLAAKGTNEVNSSSLGAGLGLTDKYMTAEPIDNPTFAGTTVPTAPAGTRVNSGGAMVSANSVPARRFTTPGQWRFTSQLERARRLNEISDLLGLGHMHFEILQREFQLGPSVSVRQYSIRYRVPGQPQGAQPQIIISPTTTAPISPPTNSTNGRPVMNGSF